MIVSQTPARDVARELEAHQRESRQKLMKGVILEGITVLPAEAASKKYPCPGGRAQSVARTALTVVAATFAGLASVVLTVIQVAGALQ